MLNYDSREQRLREAGLVLVDSEYDAAVASPEAGWKSVINMEVVPVARVSDSASGRFEKADDLWERAAAENDVFAEDGSFLISLQGENAFSVPWARVKIGSRKKFSEVFANEFGQPEFVAMSLDSRVACGILSEEDEIWIVCVSPVIRGPE